MAEAVIDRDAACVHCGYNLRGLAATGKCPECGREIATSLAIASISSHSDPRWLRQINQGRMLALGVCYAKLGIGLVLLCSMVDRSPLRDYLDWALNPLPTYCLIALDWLVFWKLGTISSSDFARKTDVSLRLARYVVTFLVVFVVVIETGFQIGQGDSAILRAMFAEQILFTVMAMFWFRAARGAALAVGFDWLALAFSVMAVVGPAVSLVAALITEMLVTDYFARTSGRAGLVGEQFLLCVLSVVTIVLFAKLGTPMKAMIGQGNVASN